MTFSEYAQEELLKPQGVDNILLETPSLAKTLTAGIQDYITDTYIRRAYIEVNKLIQAFKNNPDYKKQY